MFTVAHIDHFKQKTLLFGVYKHFIDCHRHSIGNAFSSLAFFSLDIMHKLFYYLVAFIAFSLLLKICFVVDCLLPSDICFQPCPVQQSQSLEMLL